MTNRILSTKVLEDILKETISALEDGRSQIFEVAEAAREECNRTEAILKEVRLQTQQAILTVEQVEKKYAQVRFRLYTVNKDFQDYGEETKKEIYEEAVHLREELTVAKEREKILRERRDNLEQTFVRLQEIALKAERLVSQVGVALSYLSSSVHEVNDQIEQMQVREHMGQEILRVQEVERKRMAGALHDGPVQDLANLVVQLELHERLYLEEGLPEAQANFASLKTIARGCMGEMRRIIYDLNPMTLDDLGLVPTVKNVLDDLTAQTGIETRFRLLGKEARQDSQIEVALFRIIQESVNNSRKHASPRKIEVTVEFLPHQINAEISDDGVGFDLKKVEEKLRCGGHYGLVSMQNRVHLLNGKLSIQSSSGLGTKVLVRIPLNGEEREGLIK